jgi:hypothetical protein
MASLAGSEGFTGYLLCMTNARLGYVCSLKIKILKYIRQLIIETIKPMIEATKEYKLKK